MIVQVTKRVINYRIPFSRYLPKGRSIFLLAQIAHLLQRSMVNLDLLFLKEVSHWVISAYLSELMSIA